MWVVGKAALIDDNQLGQPSVRTWTTSHRRLFQVLEVHCLLCPRPNRRLLKVCRLVTGATNTERRIEFRARGTVDLPMEQGMRWLPNGLLQGHVLNRLRVPSSFQYDITTRRPAIEALYGKEGSVALLDFRTCARFHQGLNGCCTVKPKSAFLAKSSVSL